MCKISENGKVVHGQGEKGNTNTPSTSFPSSAFKVSKVLEQTLRGSPRTLGLAGAESSKRWSRGGGLGAQQPCPAAFCAHALSRPRVTRPLNTQRRPEACRLSLPRCWFKKKHKYMSPGSPQPLLGVGAQS